MLRDEANAEADDDQRAAAAAGGSFNAGPNGESFSVRASLPCSVFTGVTPRRMLYSRRPCRTIKPGAELRSRQRLLTGRTTLARSQTSRTLVEQWSKNPRRHRWRWVRETHVRIEAFRAPA